MSSLRLPEPGNLSSKRQGTGVKGEQARVVAVEIVSAELAQDGGPAPDVRCTIAPRSSGGASRRVVGTSVCRGAWGPVWKETLRLDLEPGSRSTRFFDLVLWDESGGGAGNLPVWASRWVSLRLCSFALVRVRVRSRLIHQACAGNPARGPAAARSRASASAKLAVAAG